MCTVSSSTITPEPYLPPNNPCVSFTSYRIAIGSCTFFLQTISINDGLKSMLCELYESDCIFDKFEIALSPDGSRVLTGNYGSVSEMCFVCCTCAFLVITNLLRPLVETISRCGTNAALQSRT